MFDTLVFEDLRESLFQACTAANALYSACRDESNTALERERAYETLKLNLRILKRYSDGFLEGKTYAQCFVEPTE